MKKVKDGLKKKQLIVISTFNLYKGGSLTIYEAIKPLIDSSVNIFEINYDSKLCNVRATKKRITIKYPIKYLNYAYRLFVEQIIVPFFAYIKGANSIVFMGNFPSLLWGRPQTIFFHNTLYLEKISVKTDLKQYFERSIFKWLVILKNPQILVQSDYVANQVKEFLPSIKNVKTIGCCSSLAESERGSHSIIEIKRENLTLIYPALSYAHKNHCFLYRAAEIFKNLNIEVILTIERPEIGALKENDLNVFRFVGPVEHSKLLRLYKESHAMLFVSKTESLGLPLIEAAELGMSIVAPDLTYVNTAVDNIYEYKHDDFISLKLKLENLITDINSGQLKKARSKVSKKPHEFFEELLK